MDENNINNTQNSRKRILIFIVCFNDERTIRKVLERIPAQFHDARQYYTEILIIDNHSTDRTFQAAWDFAETRPDWKFVVLYNPKSRGYGANQKICFRYAVEHNFDAVVLLHGDNRYSPESLPEILKPILNDYADAVIGSRMINKKQALREGMPFYKWIGNQVLTFLQNFILKSKLSEFHSGFRAYNVKVLASIPYEHNSDDFDFDTDILIQMMDNNKPIKEISVPTFYGREISGAHGLLYCLRVLRSSILSRVTHLGIFYHPKFDYEPSSNIRYKEKFGFPSSHQFAFDSVRQGSTVLDIGCGPGFMSAKLAQKNVKLISIDLQIQPAVKANSYKCIEVDVEKYDFSDDFGKVDYILINDLIEHLKSPERVFDLIRQRYGKDEPTLIITTGNIAFLPMRISLLFAGFHYGRRGILDMDHARLFTFSSLKRTLELCGYTIVKKTGLPAPFPLAVKNKTLANFLLMVNRALIAVSKSLFSYQIAIIAKPLPTLENLLDEAFAARDQKLLKSNLTENK